MKRPGPDKQYWLRCVIALWALLFSVPQQANVPGEYDVKIVYLYNFTKFVSWPDSAFVSQDAPLNICILGELPSPDVTNSLQDKKSRNRNISVTLLPRQYNNEQCHILFITKSVDYALSRKIVRELTSPTLVVGETAGFAKNDGIIGFVLDDRHRVRIEVNLINARQQNINIRAQLLEIARKVYRDEEDT
jgi:hypothetical protein